MSPRTTKAKEFVQQYRTSDHELLREEVNKALESWK